MPKPASQPAPKAAVEPPVVPVEAPENSLVSNEATQDAPEAQDATQDLVAALQADVQEETAALAPPTNDVPDPSRTSDVDVDLEEACPVARDVEMRAMVGKLDDETLTCLEKRYKGSKLSTTKDKISRVLIANAFGRGDLSAWEGLVARHLREVSQGDPDMCFKYATHLHKHMPNRASEVIYWSDRALENRHVWTGNTHVTRTYSLHKMRSNAALRA